MTDIIGTDIAVTVVAVVVSTVTDIIGHDISALCSLPLTNATLLLSLISLALKSLSMVSQTAGTTAKVYRLPRLSLKSMALISLTRVHYHIQTTTAVAAATVLVSLGTDIFTVLTTTTTNWH